MYIYDRKTERRTAIKPAPIRQVEQCFYCNSDVDITKCSICLKVICLDCREYDVCMNCDNSGTLIRSSKRVESELSITKKSKKNYFFNCCKLL